MSACVTDGRTCLDARLKSISLIGQQGHSQQTLEAISDAPAWLTSRVNAHTDARMKEWIINVGRVLEPNSTRAGRIADGDRCPIIPPPSPPVRRVTKHKRSTEFEARLTLSANTHT